MSSAGKRILVDGIFLSREMKGVGRYLWNSLWRLSHLDAAHEYRVLVPEGIPLPPLPEGPRFSYLPVRLQNHLIYGLKVLPDQARRLSVDLSWVPYETALGSFPCPYGMICHDISPLVSRAQIAGGERISWPRRLAQRMDFLLVKRSLRRAAVVFCNSHYVGKWLTGGAGVNPGRVCYAPCAPSVDFSVLRQTVQVKKVWQKLKVPGGYALAFHTGDARENFRAVLEAYDRFTAFGFPESLVVAGVRESIRARLEGLLSPVSWRNRVHLVPFLGSDREQELAEIYAAASVYLDLSLHEGFGMQVIEAMACGVPVVCSNRGALPEVAGEASLLVDPTNPEGAAAALGRVLSDGGLRRQMVEKGFLRSRSFSWEMTTRAIFQGLAHILENPGMQVRPGAPTEEVSVPPLRPA